MLTVWIVPHSNPALSDIFDGAGWSILESKINKRGQRWMPEPDVIIYDVGQGPLDDTFQAYRLTHLAPLLALAADWETAWQA